MLNFSKSNSVRVIGRRLRLDGALGRRGRGLRKRLWGDRHIRRKRENFRTRIELDCCWVHDFVVEKCSIFWSGCLNLRKIEFQSWWSENESSWTAPGRAKDVICCNMGIMNLNASIEFRKTTPVSRSVPGLHASTSSESWPIMSDSCENVLWRLFVSWKNACCPNMCQTCLLAILICTFCQSSHNSWPGSFFPAHLWFIMRGVSRRFRGAFRRGCTRRWISEDQYLVSCRKSDDLLCFIDWFTEKVITILWKNNLQYHLDMKLEMTVSSRK